MYHFGESEHHFQYLLEIISSISTIWQWDLFASRFFRQTHQCCIVGLLLSAALERVQKNDSFQESCIAMRYDALWKNVHLNGLLGEVYVISITIHVRNEPFQAPSLWKRPTGPPSCLICIPEVLQLLPMQMWP